ncbi:MAG: hypothetical protein WC492_03040 [Candidatus Micrarchaeia archaeon]
MSKRKRAKSKQASAHAGKKTLIVKFSKKSRAKYAKRPSAKSMHNQISSKEKTKKDTKKFDDPLAVPMPKSWMDSKSCAQIIQYRKTQYRLWSWAVALSILLLFSVAGIEILSDMNILASPSENHALILQGADILAIFVIGLELVSSFSHSKNKALFVAENWLAILAILPIGLFARALKAFEVFALMEEISILRGFQMAGKFGEISNIVPSLEIPFEIKLSELFSGIFVSVRQVFASLNPIFLILKSAILRILR